MRDRPSAFIRAHLRFVPPASQPLDLPAQFRYTTPIDTLLFFTAEVICPDQGRVRAALEEWGVAYSEVNITRDAAAAARLRAWTGAPGMPRVPALAVVPAGEPAGGPATPSALLVEPALGRLQGWLTAHGLLPGEAG
jgi:glutaredoxin